MPEATEIGLNILIWPPLAAGDELPCGGSSLRLGWADDISCDILVSVGIRDKLLLAADERSRDMLRTAGSFNLSVAADGSRDKLRSAGSRVAKLLEVKSSTADDSADDTEK